MVLCDPVQLMAPMSSPCSSAPSTLLQPNRPPFCSLDTPRLSRPQLTGCLSRHLWTTQGNRAPLDSISIISLCLTVILTHTQSRILLVYSLAHFKLPYAENVISTKSGDLHNEGFGGAPAVPRSMRVCTQNNNSTTWMQLAGGCPIRI